MLDTVGKKDLFSEEGIKYLKDHLSGQGLSKRETEVVVLVLQGLTNKQVADKLCVAEKTVKFHLTNIYKRMKISRRSQIVWTLPLGDFVEKFKGSLNAGSTNVASMAQRNQSNDENLDDKEVSIIPKGHSTVEDLIEK